MPERFTEAVINYLGPMAERPRFHAVDYARDNLNINGVPMLIRDARTAIEPPSLQREGFMLRAHRSALQNFRDPDAVRETYLPEIRELMRDLTGAKQVLMMPGAVLRFGERSKEYGAGVNTRPARFVHVDYTPASAPELLNPLLKSAGLELGPGQRYAGFNIWRVISDPPQDVPLALCEAGSVAAGDLVPGDAIFDAPGQPEWSFEAFLVRHNPAHRWNHFSGMTRDEVLVFKAWDTDGGGALRVPHVAFDDPLHAGASPRASIECRCFALF